MICVEMICARRLMQHLQRSTCCRIVHTCRACRRSSQVQVVCTQQCAVAAVLRAHRSHNWIGLEGLWVRRLIGASLSVLI